MRRAAGALCALALVAAVAPALAQPTPFVDPDPNVLPKGDGPLYTSTAQIFAALDRWAQANPRYLRVYRAADPVTDQSFPVARFTDFAQNTGAALQRKKRVLITCAVHARELIVSEVCLNILRLLAGTKADRAPVLAWQETTAALRRAGVLARGASASAGLSTDPLGQFAAMFAQQYDLHVAPLINIDGRMLIETKGTYSQRKTATVPQVDLNRNFHFEWSASAGALSSETYPGPYPASQWETRAVVALMASVAPHAHADVHSGIAAFLTPLGNTCSQLDVPSDTLPPLQAAADAAVRIVGNFTNGPSAALLYTSLGTCSDHAYGGAGIPASITLEVYGGYTSGKNVLCPRLQRWNDACRLPASADDPATGCTTECGSDSTMRCKNILGPIGGRRLLADDDPAAEAGSPSPSSPRPLRRRPVASAAPTAARTRAALIAAARRAGASPDAARWQADLAEATAEDPGLMLPDGELLWFEWERDQQLRQQQQGGDGGGGLLQPSVAGGGGSSGGGSFAEPVPAALRHLSGQALEDAMAKRRELRKALSAELLRIVSSEGGGGGQRLSTVSAAATGSTSSWPAWYPGDPYLRHYENATWDERSMFAYFNPSQPALYRKVVSDFSAALIAYAAAATGTGKGLFAGL